MKNHAYGRARAYIAVHQVLFVYGHMARTKPRELKDIGLEKCACCGGPLRETEELLRVDVVWDEVSTHLDVFGVCPDCRSLTREEVVTTATSRVEIEFDRVAQMDEPNPLVDRLILHEVGQQPYVRRVLLGDVDRAGLEVRDPASQAVYAEVKGSRLHRRPLLVPFPWRDGEFFAVGDDVKEALRIERGVADGTMICLGLPLGNRLFEGA